MSSEMVNRVLWRSTASLVATFGQAICFVGMIATYVQQTHPSLVWATVIVALSIIKNAVGPKAVELRAAAAEVQHATEGLVKSGERLEESTKRLREELDK